MAEAFTGFFSIDVQILCNVFCTSFKIEGSNALNVTCKDSIQNSFFMPTAGLEPRPSHYGNAHRLSYEGAIPGDDRT